MFELEAVLPVLCIAMPTIALILIWLPSKRRGSECHKPGILAAHQVGRGLALLSVAFGGTLGFIEALPHIQLVWAFGYLGLFSYLLIAWILAFLSKRFEFLGFRWHDIHWSVKIATYNVGGFVVGFGLIMLAKA